MVIFYLSSFSQQKFCTKDALGRNLSFIFWYLHNVAQLKPNQNLS